MGHYDEYYESLSNEKDFSKAVRESYNTDRPDIGKEFDAEPGSSWDEQSAQEWVDFCDKLTENNDVEHPTHYTEHPSGIECIEITEHLNFCIGNAIKCLWRAGLKTPDKIKDLKKACWYINREIKRLEND